MRAKQIEVISFDIFQTLVDVNKRIPDIWRPILKEDYTDEKAAVGAAAMLTEYPSVYSVAIQSEKFQSMQEVFLLCAERAMRRIDFHVPIEDVVYHLLDQHSKAPFYSEVTECIKKLHQKYKIVLCSDSNHFMVDRLLDKIEYDECFISDDLKSYKGNGNNGFFNDVVARLNVEPQKILHVGDSTCDVTGANNVGMKSCWLNRENRKWHCDIEPDYVITDFTGLFDIL